LEPGWGWETWARMVNAQEFRRFLITSHKPPGCARQLAVVETWRRQMFEGVDSARADRGLRAR
jgi:hypothetical protein